MLARSAYSQGPTIQHCPVRPWKILKRGGRSFPWAKDNKTLQSTLAHLCRPRAYRGIKRGRLDVRIVAHIVNRPRRFSRGDSTARPGNGRLLSGLLKAPIHNAVVSLIPTESPSRKFDIEFRRWSRLQSLSKSACQSVGRIIFRVFANMAGIAGGARVRRSHVFFLTWRSPTRIIYLSIAIRTLAAARRPARSSRRNTTRLD